jgi:hypothetical protein
MKSKLFAHFCGTWNKKKISTEKALRRLSGYFADYLTLTLGLLGNFSNCARKRGGMSMSNCNECGTPGRYIAGARKLRKKVEASKTIIVEKKMQISELKKEVGLLRRERTKLKTSLANKFLRLRAKMIRLRESKINAQEEAEAATRSLRAMRSQLDKVSDKYAIERRLRAEATDQLKKITSSLKGFL